MLTAEIKNMLVTTIPAAIRFDVQYGTRRYDDDNRDHAGPTYELDDIETWRVGVDGQTVYVQRTTNGLDWPVIRVGTLTEGYARRLAGEPEFWTTPSGPKQKPSLAPDLYQHIAAAPIRREADALARLAFELRELPHWGRAQPEELAVTRSEGVEIALPLGFATYAPVALARTTLALETTLPPIVIESGKDRMAEAVGRILPGIGDRDLVRLVRKVRDVSAFVQEHPTRW